MLCSAQLMSRAPLGPCVDFACLHPTTIPTANGSKSVLGTFDETFCSLLFLPQPLASTATNTVIQSFSTHVSANQHFIVANQSFHAYAAGAIRICRGAMSLFFSFSCKASGCERKTRSEMSVFSVSWPRFQLSLKRVVVSFHLCIMPTFPEGCLGRVSS